MSTGNFDVFDVLLGAWERTGAGKTCHEFHELHEFFWSGVSLERTLPASSVLGCLTRRAQEACAPRDGLRDSCGQIPLVAAGCTV